MIKIDIEIKINGIIRSEIHQEIYEEIYNRIEEICSERKADITDLLVNDITEMTPEEAEETLMSWDLN